ncbi:MAG: aminopeptidase, partial [Balneolaceae bacterium]
MYSAEDKKLSDKLLSHSVELKEDENIMLQLIGFNGIGLLRALAESARERKANPFIKIEDPEIIRLLLEKGDAEYWNIQTKA